MQLERFYISIGFMAMICGIFMFGLTLAKTQEDEVFPGRAIPWVIISILGAIIYFS